jgi:hypothetical protein
VGLLDDFAADGNFIYLYLSASGDVAKSTDALRTIRELGFPVPLGSSVPRFKAGQAVP